jgi:hypothetical protein
MSAEFIESTSRPINGSLHERVSYYRGFSPTIIGGRPWNGYTGDETMRATKVLRPLREFYVVEGEPNQSLVGTTE